MPPPATSPTTGAAWCCYIYRAIAAAISGARARKASRLYGIESLDPTRSERRATDFVLRSVGVRRVLGASFRGRCGGAAPIGATTCVLTAANSGAAATAGTGSMASAAAAAGGAGNDTSCDSIVSFSSAFGAAGISGGAGNSVDITAASGDTAGTAVGTRSDRFGRRFGDGDSWGRHGLQ